MADYDFGEIPSFEYDLSKQREKEAEAQAMEIARSLSRSPSGNEGRGAPVRQENPEAAEMERLGRFSQQSIKAANVAPFSYQTEGGAQVRGRAVNSGQYIDVGGGVSIPVRDAMLMLDASYGKIPGTDMKPNVSLRAAFSKSFADGGPADDDIDNAVQTARELWLGPNASAQPAVTKQDIIDYARADPQQQQNLPAAKLYGVPSDYKPPSTYDRIMDVVTSPFRTYAEKTKEAAHHGSEMMSEAGKSLTMQDGRLPINAIPQYTLGALGTMFSPLTGIYDTFGEGVAQATGNREIGNRAALTAGVIDPTHVGAFAKGAARSVAPFEVPSKVAPEVQSAVQTAKGVANTPGEMPDMSRRGFLQGAGATVAAAAMPEGAVSNILRAAPEAAPAVAAPLDASKITAAVDEVLAKPISLTDDILKKNVAKDVNLEADMEYHPWMGKHHEDYTVPVSELLAGDEAHFLNDATSVQEADNIAKEIRPRIKAEVEAKLGQPVSDEVLDPIIEQQVKVYSGINQLKKHAYVNAIEGADTDWVSHELTNWAKVAGEMTGTAAPRQVGQTLDQIFANVTPELYAEKVYGIPKERVAEVLDTPVNIDRHTTADGWKWLTTTPREYLEEAQSRAFDWLDEASAAEKRDIKNAWNEAAGVQPAPRAPRVEAEQFIPEPQPTTPVQQSLPLEQPVAQLPAPQAPAVQAVETAKTAQPLDLFGVMQKVSSVAPEGNVKLRPSISQHDLKGPETQTVESFLNQVKGLPGITQESLENLALQFIANTRGDLKQPITKAEFEKLFPSSKYEKVDLKESADSAMAHWAEEARRTADDEPHISVEELLLDAGVPWRPEISRDVDDVMDILFNSRRPIDSLPTPLRDTLVEAGITDLRELEKAYDKARDKYIDRIMEDFQANHWGDFAGESGYTYENYQRLVPQSFINDHPENYFEIGVAHPDQKAAYGHYQSFQHPQGFGLVGHFRGTALPYGGPIMTAKTFLVEDRLPGEEAVRVRPPSLIEAKPNSFLIEEVQSDAQRVGQTGHLSNVHATVFKAAIQDALEKGFETVYYPTAYTIAAARGYKDSKPFRSIYDNEVIKHGLKPLEKIPGVEINKIGGDYYEINFSPDAKKYILKGPGQRLTNYADGGEVGGGNDEYASLDFSDVLPYKFG